MPVQFEFQAITCAGWDVRGVVTRMWAGEQDVDQLIAEKDIGSQLALQTIVDFAKKFEEDFPKKSSQSP